MAPLFYLKQAKSLTEKQRQEYRSAFAKFDGKGDGTGLMDPKAFGETLVYLGNTNNTEDELKALVERADLDGDGKITLEEFLNLVATMQEDFNNKSDLLHSFRQFDSDGNGYISPEELKSLLFDFDPNTSQQEVDDMLAVTDTNQDGKINYQEFLKLMGH